MVVLLLSLRQCYGADGRGCGRGGGDDWAAGGGGRWRLQRKEKKEKVLLPKWLPPVAEVETERERTTSAVLK